MNGKNFTGLKAKDFNTIEDYKNLLEKHPEIKTRSQFKEKFSFLYRHFCKLRKDGIITGEFPLESKLDYTYIEYKTIEDFQKYIDENKIYSQKEFSKNNNGLYKRCALLRLLSKIEYGRDLNTVEDFQLFVDKFKIKGKYDLNQRFRSIYLRMKKLKVEDDLSFHGKVNRFKQENKLFNTLEDFQRFIDEHHIKSPIELYNNHRNIQRRLIKLGFADKVSYGSEYDKHKHLLQNYKSVKEIQTYIDMMNIKSRNELSEKHQPVYTNYLKLSIEEREELIFLIEVINSDKIDLDNYDFDNIQRFVVENGISSPDDFRIRFKKIYNRYKRLRLYSWKKKKDIKFLKHPSRSTGEIILITELLKRGITFSIEHTFNDLRSSTSTLLRYDLFLPDYNIILEYHGPAHFGEGKYYSEDLIENDRIKYKYAIDQGIKILYFTLDKKYYDKSGYFTYIFTDLEKLFSEIDENLAILPDSFEIISEFFKEDVFFYNMIIKSRRITSEKEFKLKSFSRYKKAKLCNLLDKLTYYSEEQDLQE